MRKAHVLSLDNNNDSTVNNSLFEASSSYALSLQIFAEIYKPTLSQEQYFALMHAVDLLASYDENNNLRQGLKSDANFIDYIVDTLGNKARPNLKTDGSKLLISEMPSLLKNRIRTLINGNTHALLYGNKTASLGKGKVFHMRRFLPDSAMQSETNELILQTGGMVNHSAMARIIKVGMLRKWR